jgi:hypothetical protein
MALDQRTQRALEELTKNEKLGDSDLTLLARLLVNMAKDIKAGIKVTNPASTVRVNNIKDIELSKSFSVDNWDEMPKFPEINIPEVKIPEYPKFPSSIAVDNFPSKFDINNFPKQFKVSNLSDIKIPEVKIPEFPENISVDNLDEIYFPESIKVSNLNEIIIPEIEFPKRMKVDVVSGMEIPNFPKVMDVNILGGISIDASDIQIGAVEIKNSTDDTRATVGANGLYVDVRASALPTGAATSANQLPDGHNVTVDNVSIAVTGSFYQATQPVSLASVPSHAVTNAGTFATQVTSLPSAIQGAGNPTIDSYQTATITSKTGANQVIVSSAADKQIWVYGFGFSGTVAGTVAFQDEDDTVLTGAMNITATGGFVSSPSGNFAMPLFKLATDKDLEMDIVTTTINGWVAYAIVSV